MLKNISVSSAATQLTPFNPTFQASKRQLFDPFVHLFSSEKFLFFAVLCTCLRSFVRWNCPDVLGSWISRGLRCKDDFYSWICSALINGGPLCRFPFAAASVFGHCSTEQRSTVTIKKEMIKHYCVHSAWGHRSLNPLYPSHGREWRSRPEMDSSCSERTQTNRHLWPQSDLWAIRDQRLTGCVSWCNPGENQRRQRESTHQPVFPLLIFETSLKHNCKMAAT